MKRLLWHSLYNFCKGRRNYTNRTLRCSADSGLLSGLLREASGKDIVQSFLKRQALLVGYFTSTYIVFYSSLHKKKQSPKQLTSCLGFALLCSFSIRERLLNQTIYFSASINLTEASRFFTMMLYGFERVNLRSADSIMR
jgi:FtsH-binding integral membrane protein